MPTRLGLLDAPNERSSHRVVTPRGGGIAIIVAAVAAMLFFAMFGRSVLRAWILLAAAGGIGVLGLSMTVSGCRRAAAS